MTFPLDPAPYLRRTDVVDWDDPAVLAARSAWEELLADLPDLAPPFPAVSAPGW